MSEGLHEEDDETCLEYADAIRSSLVFLVNQTIKEDKSVKEFTAGMRKLLDKKKK